MVLEERVVDSRALCGPRTVWAEPAAGSVVRLVVFLDGEIYRDRVDAPGIVDSLRAAGHLLDTRCAFVSYGTPAARHEDFTGQERYNQFLVAELLPLLGDREPVLVGLSLSGIAAANAGVACAHVFRRTVCQSPSAWLRGEWLTERLNGLDLAAQRWWLSVGSGETEDDVRHPPGGLHQRSSQIASVTRLAAALRRHRAEVRFAVFAGGHDPACWAAELPAALAWVSGD